MGIKLYILATKEIYKEADKLDISVSNVKYIIYHFLSITKKYDWERLAFMVVTATVPKNICSLVVQIHLTDIPHQAHEYFVLIGIGNVIFTLPNHLAVSALTNLATGAIEVKNFNDKVRSYIIAKKVEG